MKINGYELNVSEEFLDDIFANKTREVKLVDKNFAGYKALTEGNKKALEHLVAAAKIFDDVAMEQDHEMNLPMKKALSTMCAFGTAICLYRAACFLRITNNYKIKQKIRDASCTCADFLS